MKKIFRLIRDTLASGEFQWTLATAIIGYILFYGAQTCLDLYEAKYTTHNIIIAPMTLFFGSCCALALFWNAVLYAYEKWLRFMNRVGKFVKVRIWG